MTSIRQDLDRILNDWVSAGLPLEPVVVVARGYRSRLESVLQEPAQAAASTRTIAERIVAGEITFSEALIAHQHAHAGDEAVGTSNSMSRRTVLRGAVESAFRGAVVRALREHAGAILEQVRQAHAVVIEEASKAIPALAGVSSEREALAGEKTARAWRTLTEAAEQRDRVLAAFESVVDLGVLTYPRDRDFQAELYHHLELLPKMASNTPAALRLRLLIESGCEPDVLAPEELQAPDRVGAGLP